MDRFKGLFRLVDAITRVRVGAGEQRAKPSNGRLEVVAEGARGAGEGLLEALRRGGTPGRGDTVAERCGAPVGAHASFVER
jgi:acylphosphatase